ncbi:hypothetical protein [Natrialba sp. SSL1]|uniref:hypothetical protein n=1 Tax=Natrialba sp. SSL1 TaxID=1869245 RepID=UPI001495D84C|nr:hypothetical protein [Natrialba sp. SSL1]
MTVRNADTRLAGVLLESPSTCPPRPALEFDRCRVHYIESGAHLSYGMATGTA